MEVANIAYLTTDASKEGSKKSPTELTMAHTQKRRGAQKRWGQLITGDNSRRECKCITVRYTSDTYRDILQLQGRGDIGMNKQQVS